MAKKLQPKREKKPAKVVSLTVHKNTLAKRKRSELRKNMAQAARYAAGLDDLAGFLVMGIGADGACEVYYELGPIKENLLPMFVHEQLNVKLAVEAAERRAG